jgi:Ca2+-binding EF-hand superfamily protein
MRGILVGALIVAATLLTLPGDLLYAQAPAPDWRQSFRVHDKNGDGRLDRAEFQNLVVDGFYFRDTGRKGYLAQSDLQGAVSPEVFKAMNRKGDGKLTMNEYLNALFQDFAAIDVNQEGAITVPQIEAYIARAKK